MTKPNNFIMNSDYLSLAQTGSYELTAVFPAEHFNSGQSIRTRDFTISPSQGAIDMFLMSLNSSDYTLGSDIVAQNIGTNWQGQSTNYYLRFMAIRTGTSTIQIQMHEACYLPDGFDMPTQTVKVKVSTFKPPNIF